jgi:pimeloyl-ACP methyl ester carboxylesterase
VPRFATFDGVVLAYETYPGGSPPVVLLHGFAADSDGNWVRPGVVEALVNAGREVVTLDARGHGQSDKPHETTAYDGDAMVRDVQALLDHLDIPSADVVGYSMGSITTAGLAAVDKRVRRAVLGGMGGALIGKGGDGSQGAAGRAAIADALVAEDPGSITGRAPRTFRRFAEQTGADRLALAAIQRSARPGPPDLAAITAPVLIITGSADVQVGSPYDLAEAIPGAQVRVVGGTHLSAVNDRAFAPAIVDFLTT